MRRDLSLPHLAQGLVLSCAVVYSAFVFIEEEVTYRFERMWSTFQQPWYYL
jgi:hypothetical protein